MEFKIDTKDSFSVIRPIVGEINANLTGALREKCGEMRQSGRNNFIIDFQECSVIDEAAVQELIAMHEEFYALDQSLVFTGLNDKIMMILKKDESDLLINIAPKMQEAIDIVSMEILERDLFKEE